MSIVYEWPIKTNPQAVTPRESFGLTDAQIAPYVRDTLVPLAERVASTEITVGAAIHAIAQSAPSPAHYSYGLTTLYSMITHFQEHLDVEHGVFLEALGITIDE